MVKYKDERKYKKKKRTRVSARKGSCPSCESNTSEGLYICHVCGKKYDFKDIHEIEINGKIKNICKKCADTFYIIS
jgi:hypothetical protein